MKKILLFCTLLLLCNFTFSQKSSTFKKVTSSNALAKIENISAEVVKNNFYLFITNKGGKKDTILLKKFEENKLPLQCKISPFMAKGIKLYSVSWIENKITETKLKTEDATTTLTEICDVTSKTKLLSNTQTVTKIKEIHFLDAKQTVSETIQKVRNEGFALSLTKEGDVILKNKTQENKMTYNPTENKFVNILITSTPKKKKQ
ncbi:hypothetical protein [Flavobacterium luteum]|uniref:Uncharacterized protein n=1 Tax=Flavobacterium luteum TaxID=2026654 RepID=A0A7J5AJ77_9FLAO|nr:hypothetical protein [Flavobacterium luteum]KAB1157671.1 hypothetical protein F6464_00895 [Flavobacterium luteum]